MNKQLQDALCLEQVYAMNLSSVEASGRHIKAVRHASSLVKTDKDKLKYQYKLTRSLQKHIMLLQSNIVENSGKEMDKTISEKEAKTLTSLVTSPVAYTEGKYSYVDVDTLRSLQVLEKAVVLKKDVALPVKVKSSNGKYKFNAQIILSKGNVLSYASNNFGYEENYAKLYRITPIERLGSGIKNNEVIEKAQSRAKARSNLGIR
jgi:hypothetical protein